MPADDTPAAPQPPAGLWWSPTHNAVVGKHKFGECFDLIEQDDLGWRDTEELSELPGDAVPLVPAPALAAIAERLDAIAAYQDRPGAMAEVEQLATDIRALLGEDTPDA